MIKPRKAMDKVSPYQIYNESRKEKIRLDLNENSLGCSPRVLDTLKNLSAIDVSIYPEYGPLLNRLAEFYNIDVSNLTISNGADDSIRCIFDCFVEEGDEILLPVPNYGMFDIFSRIRNANVTEVLYHDDFSFPTREVISKISDRTKLIIIVNPANPLSTAIDEKDLLEILRRAENSIIVLDETYHHFLRSSCIDLIHSHENLVIVQTFSKAFGLTGLRLGLLLSNPKNIEQLNKVNLPFAVNSIAVKAAEAALEDTGFIESVVRHVETEKSFLISELQKLGLAVFSGYTNYIMIKIGEKNNQIYEALQRQNILVRNLDKYPMLQGYLRMTIGTREDNQKLLAALRELLPIQGVLFDMDGVLVDVSRSYRFAIQKTVASFTGQEVDPSEIEHLKNKGGYNNDWILTKTLLQTRGIDVPLETIINKFQEFYLGNNFDGFIQNETWLLNKDTVDELSRRYKLGVVTGRPRQEAQFALNQSGLEKYFEVLIAMEDTEPDRGKPFPDGLLLAKEKLGVNRAVYLGDTLDDMKAATAAGVIPIGVLNEDQDKQTRTELLKQYGAQHVLPSVNSILEVLK